MSRFAPSDPLARLVVIAALVILGLIVVAAVAARLALRRRAAARHGLWLATLALVVLSPALVASFDRAGRGRWTIPVRFAARLPQPGTPPPVSRLPMLIPPAPVPVAAQAPREVDPPPLSPPDRSVPVGPPPLTDPEAPRPIHPAVADLSPSPPPRSGWTRSDWAGLAVLVWLAGLSLGLIRLGVGWLAWRGLRPSLLPLDQAAHAALLAEVRGRLPVAALPPIFTSSRVAGPFAAGLIRPCIVVPVGLTAGELRDVLIHEAAHVVRRDLWVGLVQRVVGVVLWPHLAVAYLNRQLSRAREEVCDNFVLNRGDARGYARTLLALTERRSAPGLAAPALGIVGHGWTLADRVAGLLDPQRNRMTHSSLRTRILTTITLAGVGLTLAALRFDTPPALAAGASTLEPAAPPGDGRRVTGIVVDAAGQPVPGAVVRPVRLNKAPDGAVTAADGTFTLTLRGDMLLTEDLIAEADDGARLGLGKFSESPTTAPAEPVRIVLQPSRAVTIHVRDAAGLAVAGAAVEVIADSSHRAGQTGPDGAATIRIPTDSAVRQVVAFKAGVGFDTFENDQTQHPATADLSPLPAEVSLTLDGASTVRVHAVDSAGRPVAGVRFAPWTISKPGRLDPVNLSSSAAVGATTGADGTATFAWLPPVVEADVWFLVTSAGYSCPDPPVYRGKGTTDLTARILRNTRISGVVHQADGQPARNLLIQAEGRGHAKIHGRKYTRTGLDGGYSLDVVPDQTYLVAVIDEAQAARSLTGIAVREGQTRDGLDLTLVPGTLVQGQVTRGADPTPAAGVDVSLSEDGAPPPDQANFTMKFTVAYIGSGVTQIDGANVSIGGMLGEQKLVRSATTDAQGRYRFRVGPGRFDVMVQPTGPALQTADLTVTSPDAATVTRDFHLTEPEPTPFTGRVVERVAGGSRPVGGVMIEAIGTWDRRGFAARTDATGRFRGARSGGGPLVVSARSVDGKLAGFATFPAAARDGEVTVAPAATVFGRVVDAQGKPRGGYPVLVQLNSPAEQIISALFFHQLRTDERGRYTLAGVAAGSHGEASISPEAITQRPWRVVQPIEVPSTAPVELLDLVIPDDPPAQKQPEVANNDPPPRLVVPTVTTPREIEDLIRAVGRDPVTPELVDRVGIWFRPHNAWAYDLGRTRRLATDPGFVARLDALARAQQLPPPDTALLVRLAVIGPSGEDATALANRLKRLVAARQGPAVTFTGMVDAATTGRPVAGAVVMTNDDLTRTDAAGRFALPVWPGSPSPMPFWVEADGYALREVDLDPADRAAQAIHLVRSVPVEGQVLGPAGRPVAGALVQVSVRQEAVQGRALPPRGAGGSLQPIAAWSNDQGWFSVPSIPPFEEDLLLQVTHPDFQDGVAQVPAPPSVAGPVVVRLQPGAVVSGVVVDEQGRGVPGAPVGLRIPASDGGNIASAITDASGRYRFGTVQPGRWDLLIEPAEFAPVVVPVVADFGVPVENQVVVSPGAFIRGRTIDAAGQPVAGATIRWVQSVDRANLRLNLQATTATDGSFRLGPLPPGEFRFLGSAGPPYIQGKTTAKTDQTDALIRLTPNPVTW